MGARNSYGQFCALARALDHVGDRWTLLIIRELLLGPETFRALQNALHGIGPNLLVDRLRSLEHDGLVERNDAPPRSKAVTYRLTERGAGLDQAVLELIRWGAQWMAVGPGDDRIQPAWAALALRALLDGPTKQGRSGTVHLELTGGVSVTIKIRNGRRTVRPGRPQAAAARIIADLSDALAVASGFTTPTNAALTIDGDNDLARAALSPNAANDVLMRMP